VSTPSVNLFNFSLEQCSKAYAEGEYMWKVDYAIGVGYLIYAMVSTRPYFTQAVSQVVKFMSKLGKHH